MNEINFFKSGFFDLFTGDKNEKANGYIYHSFEADYELFDDRKCNISIFFPHDKDPQSCLNDNMDSIKEQIEWVASNRDTIVDFLVDDSNIIKSAEHWVRNYKKAEKIEGEDCECYLMRDGSKISLPITKEGISNSLRFIGVSVRFEEDNDKPRMDFCLEFEPNYFMGCFVVITADVNKQLTYVGLVRNRDVEI